MFRLSHHFASLSPTDCPRLPFDILAIIVEFLADDKKTLLTICKVCSYLVAPAQRQLFRQLRVAAPPKRFETFLDFLVTKPDIRNFVRELALVGSNVDEQGRKVSADQRALLASSLLNELVKMTPNLRALSLVGVTLKATKMQFPIGNVNLDYLALIHPVLYHDSFQDYASTLVPFMSVGTLRIEQSSLPESHLPGNHASLTDDHFHIPLLFGAQTIELDIPDPIALAQILSVLTFTWSVRDLKPEGPQLRSLDISCYDTRALSQFTREGCATLEHFRFDLSRWLDIDTRDGLVSEVQSPTFNLSTLLAIHMQHAHIDHVQTTDIGEELGLEWSCPKLQSITLLVASNQIMKAPEETFRGIASILRHIPSSAHKLALEIDLGHCASSALVSLAEPQIEMRWHSLRELVELARITTVDFEFRRAAGGEPVDQALKQMVALKLIDALAPAGAFLGFRYEDYIV